MRRSPLPHRRPRLVLSLRPPGSDPAHRLLHVSRRARQRYGLDQGLFALDGRVVLADLAAARRLAQQLADDPLRRSTVTPGQLFAAGLIHELLHEVVERYRRQTEHLMARALAAAGERLGGERLEATLLAFTEQFPPLAVWRGEVSAAEYLAGHSAGRPHRELVLEEMLLLWVANDNPALSPLSELFSDAELRSSTAYGELMAALETFFDAEPAVGAAGVLGQPGPRLLEVLRLPARQAPHSLLEQLELLARNALLLGADARAALGAELAARLERLLRATDLLREEQRPVFPPGPGPVEVPEPGLEGDGPEAFSRDLDWMPSVVLLAKNAYVWLDQLSRAHGREIRRLDQIPDAELDRLARWGITGLWLIGVWERSAASERIKQLCGNPEAAASAYSLWDYEIAATLGGEAARADLEARARRRGIRLACDMVPNHFGVDSRWMMEHPERFLSLPEPPYPAYSFNGPDLSSEPGIGIYIEDHYYDRSDAAVVFKRLDRASGEARYVYHGNDGTSMPWNDTAQLDYLNPETREAVIQTILGVARRFPVIRFDAAMTLARRHVRRLWYPEPGAGGAIPSRSEHGLSAEEFNRRMPEELWRQVVDRVAAEVPDTLLLAEAFWLMEGYFVRTLGMHRVYNSAFMHMLRDERNADYRQAIKNTLEFDPEILKRYVNFLNNPDEETALAQFGDGDKYFGVFTLAVTLPGLPMVGHGQIEGFAEKYGMEYRRAYYDEEPKGWLVERHERQIFPLLHRRRLFAESLYFRLYDFEADGGGVDENVFAYSNRLGGEHALVIYHNRFGSTRGRLRHSASFAVKGGGEPVLLRQTLGQALELGRGEPRLVLCRDQVSGLEHLFDGRAILERGLELALNAYQCHVFLDFRFPTPDPEGRWWQLAERLGGRGVPSVEEAYRELRLAPVLEPLQRLLAGDRLGPCLAAEPPADELLATIEGDLRQLAEALAEQLGVALPSEPSPEPAEPILGGAPAGGDTESWPASPPGGEAEDGVSAEAHGEEGVSGEDSTGAQRPAAAPRPAVPFVDQLAARGRRRLAHALRLLAEVEEAARRGGAEGEPGATAASDQGGATDAALASLADGLGDITAKRALLYPWRLLDALAPLASASGDGADGPRAWLDDLLFGKKIAAALEAVGRPHDEAGDAVDTLALLLASRLAPLGPSADTTPPDERDPESAKSQDQEIAPAPLRQEDGGPSDSGAEATEATDRSSPLAAETPGSAAASPSHDPPAPRQGAGSESPPATAARRQRLGAWLAHPDVRRRLRVHEWDGHLWLHRESLEELLWWSLFAQALEAGLHSPETAGAARAADALRHQAEAAGWCLEHLLAAEAPRSAS